MIRASFAVPGDLGAPTGGYGYARRLLAEAGGAGVELAHLALPGGFPDPSPAELGQAGRLLGTLPAGRPILIDGLALGVLPADLLRALPGPVVALCHHPLALETGTGPQAARRLRASERAALAACARIVASSATTAATLSADYGVPGARLTVACPGTDPAPRAAGSGGPGVAILSVGALIPRKGHDVLIAALAGLAELDWRLTIAGPMGRDAVHADELIGLVGAAGLQDRVGFAGALDAGGIARAYDRADLFVLASRHEGFGMAYTEAMAHGLAVVGCTAGAVAEATRGAALLVAPGDAAALRAALAPLIGDGAARARLAEACWRAARGFVRWPDTAARVAQALRQATP
ncbi:MAG: glycosyltransferase family 4 protein [Proteobacteria bacterium]|nr:glycosyltransferase family 4 protein [Pseudomonadota bacterium]